MMLFELQIESILLIYACCLHFSFRPSPNWCFNSEKLANVFGIGILQMLLSVGMSDTALNLQQKKRMLNVRVQCSWFVLWSAIHVPGISAKQHSDTLNEGALEDGNETEAVRKHGLVVYSGYYVVCYGNLAITPEIHGSRKILHRSTIFSLSYTQELISFNF